MAPPRGLKEIQLLVMKLINVYLENSNIITTLVTTPRGNELGRPILVMKDVSLHFKQLINSTAVIHGTIIHTGLSTIHR